MDHKLLIPLFSAKHLEELPVRVQRFRLLMLRFDFNIVYILGKNLVIADSFSKAPLMLLNQHDKHIEEDVQACNDILSWIQIE